MFRVSASASWAYGTGQGEASAEYENNFSDVTSNAEYTVHTEEEELDLRLDVPNYVYNKRITIIYQNGVRQEISGGLVISHDWPITEKRVITYEKDGHTVKSDTY